ncbi:hypothetical protein B0T24DRAFT_699858 [Lasiosphaeria ovina]|uniref:Mid2 domain-containing protein n=1 Tax=Lasiosphaeria ovina TaxID=92902 RepID=A0AAE0KHQ3_9PEZI|nr:hypothetical protein B0T24DRAFT_699858 [Lasiosphaeria ovina]
MSFVPRGLLGSLTFAAWLELLAVATTSAARRDTPVQCLDLAICQQATLSSTRYVTSSYYSTVYSSGTSWEYTTSTHYSTTTTHSQGGVSTSTVWVTVTTTRNAKRAAPTVPTPTMTQTHGIQGAAVLPTVEPVLIGGQTPITDMLRRGLEEIGLLERRAITSYITVPYTSTYYSYIYTTVGSLVTSTSSTVVESTITSTVVDDASSTRTVTSTTTSTVGSGEQTPPVTPPVTPPAGQQLVGSSGSSSLNTAKVVGIIVSAVCAVLGLTFTVIWRIYVHKKRRREKESGPGNGGEGQNYHNPGAWT